jgi:ubiquitin C-terminal hydrolase
LQGLYYCQSFRNAIFNNNIKDSPDVGNRLVDMSLKDILRDLYGRLDSTSQQSASSTTSLVTYLKLSPSIQEDAQEFYLKLIDTINSEELDKDRQIPGMHHHHSGSGNIASLFTGTFENYVQCRDVPFAKTKLQKFRDLSVEVSSDLLKSLKKLLEASLLEGDNMYKTDAYGKQVAWKGSKIIALPEILVVQINRFAYDMNQGRRVKVS